MVKSRSVKAIILASGQGLTTLVGIVSAALLSRLFSKDDYATYRQTMLAYTFAAPFIMLGFNQALYYFLPSEKHRPRGVLVENLLLLVSGGLLLTVFLLLGGNELLAWRFGNPKLATTLLLLAPYPLLMAPLATTGACLLARDRAGQVAIFNVVSRIIMLGAVLIPVCIWQTPSVAILGVVAGTSISTGIALLLMFRACTGGDWRPTRDGIRSQVKFSIPLGLASLAGAITLSLDKVMVASMCPAETFAVYINGAMEIPLIGIVTGSVTSVLIVEYTKLYRENRTSEIVGLIHRAIIKCALILLPVMAFLLCLAPEVMRFLFSAAYEESAAPFRVYLLVLPIRTLTFGAILMATGNSRYVLVASILTLVANAILTWLAILSFGMIGAAFATVASVYFVNVPYMTARIQIVLRQPLSKLFPWWQFTLVAIASSAGIPLALVAKYLLTGHLEILILAVSGIAYGLSTLAAFVYLRFVDPSTILTQLRGALRGKV